MLSPKLNVYRIGWLDVVFANRNKGYGAYELRLHYHSRLLKALFFASVLFVGVISGVFLYNKGATENVISDVAKLPDDVIRVIEVTLPKKEPVQAPPASKPPAAEPVKTNTKKFVALHVVPHDQAIEEPPTLADLHSAAIGQQDVAGKPGELNAAPAEINTGTGGTGSGVSEGTTDKIFITAQKAPMFPGGIEAFSKYLRKNLRYPALASEMGISGRVIVSFVVERNGDLSDIKIIRGIGGGCDEEAIRVLRKAPAWSPGEQNGQKVRVQYTVPIVFNMGN